VTVLVVDDDQDLRVLVRLALEQIGYLVLEASDGIQAWETISRDRPVLAVVDVQMPELDGLKLCARVKRDGLPTRLLVYSALPCAEAARDAGADGFCEKDGSLTPLRNAIARLVA